MKRWLWRIITFMVLGGVFIGFGITKNVQNDQQYNHYMSRGIAKIKAKKYSLAKTEFSNALTKKPNAIPPRRYLTQLDAYQAGISNFKSGNYSVAKQKFQAALRVENGSGVINERASQYVLQMTQIITLQKRFNQAYNQAKKLANQYQYTASNEKLATILDNSAAKQSYYKSIYQKAKQLLSLNNTYLAQIALTNSQAQSSSQTQYWTNQDATSTPQVNSSANSAAAAQTTAATSTSQQTRAKTTQTTPASPSVKQDRATHKQASSSVNSQAASQRTEKQSSSQTQVKPKAASSQASKSSATSVKANH